MLFDDGARYFIQGRQDSESSSMSEGSARDRPGSSRALSTASLNFNKNSSERHDIERDIRSKIEEGAIGKADKVSLASNTAPVTKFQVFVSVALLSAALSMFLLVVGIDTDGLDNVYDLVESNRVAMVFFICGLSLIPVVLVCLASCSFCKNNKCCTQDTTISEETEKLDSDSLFEYEDEDAVIT